MKYRLLCVAAITVLFHSGIEAQSVSHFDLSGNVSFNGATVPGSSGNTQVHAFGWQTSGVTRFNRLLGVTSQFGSGYASSDAVQLLGYTGPSTLRHYSLLVGPRITLPVRGRFSPYVEGLVGADHASTSLTSSGVAVTGREVQLAYAIGGGAQINLSRHFGLNFGGQYFSSEHSTAFTGWEPSHLQFSAGIVIRMVGRTPQIAETRPASAPTETVTASAPERPVANSTASADAVSTTHDQPMVTYTPPEVASANPTGQTQVVQGPAPAISTPPTPLPAQSVAAQQPAITAPTTAPVASVGVVPAVPAAQPNVRPAAPVSQPVQMAAAIPAVADAQNLSDTQAQVAAPVSLGEYARRLREKKQQQNH